MQHEMNNFFEKKIVPLEQELRRYIWNMTQDSYLVDEILQETMKNAWEKNDQIQYPESDKAIRGWLFRIAENNTNMHRRKEARRSKWVFESYDSEDNITHDISDKSEPIDDMLINALYEKTTFEALLKLNIDDRRLIAMRCLNGMLTKEIAEVLGINYSTTRTNLARAIKRYQNAFWKIIDGDEKI